MARIQSATDLDKAASVEIERPELRRTADASYTVVARRYRPQTFEDVVGQDHVVQALRNAIRLQRVTHAYLFSGTRGVGKTSIARIFAKCLNCVKGPTDRPCLECDICRAIAVGQDVDVIEIDGASNNGVEAVRELRQNAGLRPSRARFKIYYIDEVHMLSTGAFNALLKTLEEPPEHVKFFFATTEKNKIPITVLSRCQNLEFAGIGPEAIESTLAEIVRLEGAQADPAALRLVARRANGSLRDAQSLLEQLLSSGQTPITAEIVQRVLGLAADDRILDLIDALARRKTAEALSLLDQMCRIGAQPAEILGGAIEFLRDLMVLHWDGAAEVPLLAASTTQAERLKGLAAVWPLENVLGSLEIMAEARGRLRGSPHGRLLVEMAVCRVSRLDDLTELSELIARLSALESGGPLKKKSERTERVVEPSVVETISGRPAGSEGSPANAPAAGAPATDGRSPAELLEAVRKLWDDLTGLLGSRLSPHMLQTRPTAFEPPNTLVVGVPPDYNSVFSICDEPETRGAIEKTIGERLGRPQGLSIRFEIDPALSAATGISTRDLFGDDPFARRVMELFDARPTRGRASDGG